MRVEAYKLCRALAEAALNLAAPSSPVPVETLVALCVRGLDDESPAARLSAAAAMGASLAAGAEGNAAENERLGVIAARDQVNLLLSHVSKCIGVWYWECIDWNRNKFFFERVPSRYHWIG